MVETAREDGWFEGYDKGEAEGKAKGRAEGEAKGRAEGKQETTLEIAQRMRAEGWDEATIQRLTMYNLN